MDCQFCSQVEPQYATLDHAVLAVKKLADELLSRGRRVLFRGESCCFPTTSPGMLRLLTDPSLDFEEKSFLLDATERFLEEFEEELGDRAEMFMQHYGLPTDLIDFTSDLEVAFFFACCDKPSHRACIAVMDQDTAETQIDIFNLKDFHIADGASLIRPNKQKAFAVRHHPGSPPDLKDPGVSRKLGITWISFQKGAEDTQRFADKQNILSTEGDTCAALLRDWLTYHASTTWTEEAIAQVLTKRVVSGLNV